MLTGSGLTPLSSFTLLTLHGLCWCGGWGEFGDGGGINGSRSAATGCFVVRSGWCRLTGHNWYAVAEVSAVSSEFFSIFCANQVVAVGSCLDNDSGGGP